MSERILAAVLLLIAVLYGREASGMKVPFSYDPLGPSSFPFLLAILLGTLSVFLLLRPARISGWPHGAMLRRVGMMAVTLTTYAFLLFQLGFLISTVLAGTALARLVNATWRQSLATGLGTSAIFYILFVQLLDVALPDGRLVHAVFGM